MARRKPQPKEPITINLGLPKTKAERENAIVDETKYNEMQTQMLLYMLNDDSIRAIYSHGGVRSGKSLCVCKLCAAIAYKYPGSRVLVARDTRVNLKNTTLATFFGLDKYGRNVILPQLYKLENYNKTEGTLTWNNGSVTCFWGLDAPEDIEKVKSTEWSAIIVEEAPGVDIEVITFLLETRLSHAIGPHKMLLTSNTDGGHSDVYRMFYDDHNRQEDGGKDCETCGEKCSFRAIASTTLVNKDNLDDKYLKNLMNLKRTNPRYFDVYVMGKFQEFTQRIFPEFDPLKHVVEIPPEWKPPDGSVHVFGYDHGFAGAPSCLLECVILPDGTYLFWDEFYPQGLTVKQMAEIFKERDVLYVHAADPSIRNKTQYRDQGEGSGELQSVQDLYQAYGVSMELANNDVNGGIEKMKSLLIDDPEHPHPILEDVAHCPYILIARRAGKLSCPNLFRQFQKYRNQTSAKGAVNQTKWMPHKEDDHAIDPCFCQDTMVTTLSGDKKISDVRAGERVLSATGFVSVLAAGKTGVNKELWELELEDGTRVKATKNHKFFVSGRGKVSLCDLRYGDKIVVCRNLNEEFSMANHSIVIQHPQGGHIECIFNQEKDCYIEGCGKVSTAIYRLGIIFITKITILETMLLKIWKLFTDQRTTRCTASTEYSSSMYVWFVEMLLKARMFPIQSSVQVHVKQNIDCNPASIMLTDYAADVRNLSAQTSTLKRGPVLDHVPVKSFGKTGEKEDVYCLTTADGMFFANGMLVKNCRYITNSPLGPGVNFRPGPKQGTIGHIKVLMRQKMAREELGQVEVSDAV